MPITLLITDDNKIILDTWKYILGQDSRFKVIGTCTSGEKAIEETLKLNPDIVIMDNNMPGMSGIEATAIIRKNAPNTKVLGFSLNSEPVYARKFLAAGADDYIEKTATIEKITSTLFRIYHNQPGKVPGEKNDTGGQY